MGQTKVLLAFQLSWQVFTIRRRERVRRKRLLLSTRATGALRARAYRQRNYQLANWNGLLPLVKSFDADEKSVKTISGMLVGVFGVCGHVVCDV